MSPYTELAGWGRRMTAADLGVAAYAIVMLFIFTGVIGRSFLVGVLLIALTTSMPLVTLPNTGCLDRPPEK